MSSLNLDLLTSKFPQDIDAIYKLADLIENRVGKNTELSLERIIDISNPSSNFAISSLLQMLVSQGIFKRIIRLEVNDSAVKDYESLDQIPNIEHDWRNDVDVEVRPENLRIYYKILA